MIINEIKFPIYGVMILLSLVAGCTFLYFYLHKIIEKKYIFLFIVQYVSYSLITGVSFKFKMGNIEKVSLSSYGGAIGAIIAAIVFEKIYSKKNVFIKASILSLPLVYSISKLGCFFAGCCYGLPYKGIFSVTYTADLNIPLVPIQLMETITFLIIFIISLYLKNNKNQVFITLIISALAKFLLDFLRYDHLTKIITTNQIISIIFIIIAIIMIMKNKSRQKR